MQLLCISDFISQDVALDHKKRASENRKLCNLRFVDKSCFEVVAHRGFYVENNEYFICFVVTSHNSSTV